MSFRVGDKVCVIDSNLIGDVLSVSKNEVKIKTSDGFEEIHKTEKLIKLEDNIFNNLFLDLKQKEKIIAEKREQRKEVDNLKLQTVFSDVIEVDLHIEKLVKNPNNIENKNILSFQINAAKKILSRAKEIGVNKIIFIHGVGEGILKNELENLLINHSQDLLYYPANFSNYGNGATEVRFKT
tara:strand:+ start:88124 stop:88669 length:546 start_codon:yes stop_codon:yes gene_type:complete